MLIGLALFHQQTQIPAIWHWVSAQIPSTAVQVLLGLVCLLTLSTLSRNSSNQSIWSPTTRWLIKLFNPLFAALVFSQLLAGPIAAERLSKRVPIECHQTDHPGLFKIEQVSFLPEGAKKWTLSVIQANTGEEAETTCLHQGALLSVVINPNTAEHLLNTPPGELIQATVKIKAPKSTLQMHGFDVQAYWFSKGISGLATLQNANKINNKAQWLSPLELIQKLRFSTGQWITHTLKNHPQQGLVLALVTGDQGLIAPEEREVFNNTGIAHLVAISGLHITMLAGLACWVVSRLWRLKPRLTEFLPAGLAGQYAGIVIALIYGLLAGWGVPAQRTVLMQAGFLISHLYPGRVSVWNVYWSAMLIGMLIDPWVLFDIGFYLSFGAVGILIFSGWGYRTFKDEYSTPKQKLRGFAQAAFKAQYVATVGLIPFCAALFNQQSLISPLVNALSIPWMSFISTPLSMLGTLTGNSWLLHIAAQSLDVQQVWLEASQHLGLITWNLPTQAVWVYAVAVIGVFWVLLPRGVLPRWPGVLALCTLLLPVQKAEQGEFWMDVLDVGQGTAVVIRTQNYSLLYDTGPAFTAQSNSARRVILPWLKIQGITQLDQLWLSHDDADHTGGAMVLLQNHTPKHMVSPLQHSHGLALQAKVIHTQHLDCKTLQPWQWDGVTFIPISLPASPPNTDLGRDNNQSCLLKIANAKHSLLLSGDIEAAAEQALLDDIRTGQKPPNHLQASVLYAPHHGSKTSSSQAFLDAVNPSTVVIQSGWKNRYKHPHQEVLNRYQGMNLTLFHTAQVGALHSRFKPGYDETRVQSALHTRLRYWHMHESSAFQR
ncbi:MAG: DNA internalization-related competence protein ComEC/Rec2 [Limnobacter sp.]|nr:DNA internalization-related competence protein ComEC/Rec2 [Limnobacter sp.]